RRRYARAPDGGCSGAREAPGASQTGPHRYTSSTRTDVMTPLVWTTAQPAMVSHSMGDLMPSRLPNALLLAVVVLAAARADAVERIACPDGEITLAVERARLVRRGAGHDRLRISGGAFTLPRGVVATPGDEPVVV